MASSLQEAVKSVAHAIREPQPLSVLQIPDAQLTIRTVCAVTAMSESSLRRAIKAGTFPQPVRRGPRCTRFIAADVSAWLRAQRVQP